MQQKRQDFSLPLLIRKAGDLEHLRFENTLGVAHREPAAKPEQPQFACGPNSGFRHETRWSEYGVWPTGISNDKTLLGAC